GADGAADSALLLAELASASAEIEVAFRDRQRYVSGLDKIDFESTPRAPIPFRQGGLYLVTGGLGALGTEIANLLLTRHDAHLLLVGRTPLADSDQRQHAFNRLSKAGSGQVRYQALDIGDRNALGQAVAAAERAWGQRLAGVIHLAGVATPARFLRGATPHYQPIEHHHVVREPLSAYHQMFQAKVYGSFNLMQLLEPYPEAIWISFGSV
ncbi:MAG: SDR family NAD(P)-dependent oxidoreductase, partial [Bradyrhizobium sp.]|nr:SDR family NAD(P)-dependent oxidoreductase [Bradyrhizobium sp.]